MQLKFTFLLLVGFFFFHINFAKAQDPFFTQHYMAPIQTNPGLVGVFNGKFRVTANYKQYWNSILQDNPFRTTSVGFEMRSPVGREDFINYGVTVLNDEAGVGNFQRNTGHVNLSFMKQLGGGGYRSADQFLIAGAMAGVGQFSVDASNFWFSNQFDMTTETINTSIDNMEMINNTSDVFIDINAGLTYYAVFAKNMSVYAGGALFHVNSPEASLMDGGSAGLDMRWVAQAGAELPINNNLSVLPSVLFTQQGESMLGITGANLRYTNRDWREVAIRAGGFVHLSRQADFQIADTNNNQEVTLGIPTVSVVAILEMERFNFGVSYDIAVNRLELPTNNRGGFELSLSYIHPGSRKEKVRCPKY